MLREENDVDEKLGADNLYQTVKGLERTQLEVAIKYVDIIAYSRVGATIVVRGDGALAGSAPCQSYR